MPANYEIILKLGLPLFMLIVFGIGIGGLRERRHLRRLALREAENADVRLTNLKRIPAGEEAANSSLVVGQVVIASDYFKTFMAKFRNMIGGEMKGVETLMNRARREAILRMIEDAKRLGATEVHNVRFVTCNINAMSSNQGGIAIELCAYGTAVVRTSRASPHHVQA